MAAPADKRARFADGPGKSSRGDFLARTHIGLDYFDASINRIAAWTIGTRNAIKALLIAMLEPADMVFFGHGAGNDGHVALYLGGGQIVQCSSSGNGSNIRPLAGYVTPTGWIRWRTDMH